MKRSWAENLSQMKSFLAEVEDLEKRDIPASDKAAAWDRLLKAFGDDNPYSNEDDAIINKANKQLEYWA